GLAHHSFGLVDEAGFAVPPGKRSKRLAVKAVGRPPAKPETKDGKLSWDYSAYSAKPDNVLVPLEVVFRFGAPEGSSFLKRMEEIPGYAQTFGFADNPAPNELFPFPIVEFFTKLEPTDRFLTRVEACALAALSQEELEELVTLNLLLALRLRDLFLQLGLELWDGKFEFAFSPGAKGQRKFLLVDSIGPDELRLIGPGGVHFSKEFLRRIYRDTPWYEAMEKAKKLARQRGEKDWKKICREELAQSPAAMPREALESAELLYPALANSLGQLTLGRAIFAELAVANVAEVCVRLKGGVDS
ncbi:MAG: phosphoribosylaminoimidazolesuccinocarboxamide synthase, partial [Bdellovibrionota bacterium]